MYPVQPAAIYGQPPFLNPSALQSVRPPSRIRSISTQTKTEHESNPLTLKLDTRQKNSRATQIIHNYLSLRGIASLIWKKKPLHIPSPNHPFSVRLWNDLLREWRIHMYKFDLEGKNLGPENISTELRNQLTTLLKFKNQQDIEGKKREKPYKTIDELIFFQQTIPKNQTNDISLTKQKINLDKFPHISFENFVRQIFTIISLHEIFNGTFLWGKGNVPVPLYWENPSDIKSSNLNEFMRKLEDAQMMPHNFTITEEKKDPIYLPQNRNVETTFNRAVTKPLTSSSEL
jgi:hypothetical protein